jgi:hypothetical protein
MQSTAAVAAPEIESTRRCTGPRTCEGKQKSSKNSTKHGCCSKQLLLPQEDPEEWEALKSDWLQSYDTSDPVSFRLVMHTAEMQWQQIRAQNAFSVAQYAIYDEQPDCTLWTDEHHKLYSKFQRYLSAAERSFLRAFHEVERLRRTQRKQEEVAFKQNLDRQRFTLRQDKNHHEIALIQAKADFCVAKSAAINRPPVPKTEKASPPA